LFGSAHLVHVDGVLTAFMLSPNKLFPPPSKRHKRTRRSHDICVTVCGRIPGLFPDATKQSQRPTGARQGSLR
jgi:hypothetical protein